MPAGMDDQAGGSSKTQLKSGPDQGFALVAGLVLGLGCLAADHLANVAQRPYPCPARILRPPGTEKAAEAAGTDYRGRCTRSPAQTEGSAKERMRTRIAAPRDVAIAKS